MPPVFPVVGVCATHVLEPACISAPQASSLTDCFMNLPQAASYSLLKYTHFYLCVAEQAYSLWK
jgi:hypothetical protein